MRRRSPARPEGTHRRGFTLVEMLVVVVVIAILATVMVPSMRGTLEDALLRSSARQWVDVCGIAQSRAVSLNQIHRVRLDPATGQFFLERRVRGARGGGGFVRVQDVPDGRGTLDERITVQRKNLEAESEPVEGLRSAAAPVEESSPPLAWIFHPDGTAEGGDLVMRDREGFGLMLQLNPVTGRVRLGEAPRR